MQPLQPTKSSWLIVIFVIIFGVIWAAIPSPFFFRLIGIGIVLLILWPLAIRPMLAGVRVPRPQVSIAKESLHVGEQFDLMYEQTFKRAVDVTSLSLQLILRELATYQRGTDTVTDTHDFVVQQIDPPVQHFEAGETYSHSFRLKIPDEAMHTFKARRNELRWLIKVAIGTSRWPDFKMEYPITVSPERAE